MPVLASADAVAHSNIMVANSCCRLHILFMTNIKIQIAFLLQDHATLAGSMKTLGFSGGGHHAGV